MASERILSILTQKFLVWCVRIFIEEISHFPIDIFILARNEEKPNTVSYSTIIYVNLIPSSPRTCITEIGSWCA